jgi:arylformamidase
MDINTLEKEYSPSTCIRNYNELINEYGSKSKIAESTTTVIKDISYGKSKEECLDFFPAADKNSPLLVFFHGGYWQLLSKNESTFPAPHFVSSGINFAAINYTLAPQASIDEITEECRRSIIWLFNHADKLGMNPEKIFLLGSSAGAHLAAMLLLTDWDDYQLPSNAIKGATLLSGIYDLRPIAKTYINEPLVLNEQLAEGLSPLFLVQKSTTQIIISWGEHETSEFKRQSTDFANAWKKMGNTCTIFEEKNTNHFDILFQMENERSNLKLEMLKQILGEGR